MFVESGQASKRRQNTADLRYTGRTSAASLQLLGVDDVQSTPVLIARLGAALEVNLLVLPIKRTGSFGNRHDLTLPHKHNPSAGLDLSAKARGLWPGPLCSSEMVPAMCVCVCFC